ncbi:MAG TPA: hypothetical protein PLF50_00565 [Candidatus Cloacimonadota bacterium]|nr:hypothetical protein [Candidatus Cloacimonadota bacterium]
MKLGIFNSFYDQHMFYVQACEKLGVDYQIIDIISPKWIDNILQSDCDGYLCRPPTTYQDRKTMFDERLYIINKILLKPIYPSYDELYIYENKRMMYYWLELNNFPHPDTEIFYFKKDFYDYLKNAEMPLVIKSNIGSTSKGVTIVKSKTKAKIIAELTFGWPNPKFSLGYTAQKTGKIIPFPAIGTLQRHYLIVQKFEKIKWEWRVVRIGNFYFGHQKLLKGNFASGSKLKGWEAPSEELLFLAKKICDKGNFLSMDLDIFETIDGRYLVNELQSIWGQSTEHLMYYKGQPGRFVFQNNAFVFEEGSFTQFSSYLLRTQHFVQLLREGKYNEN